MALSEVLTGVPIQIVVKTAEHVNSWLDLLQAFADDSLGADHPYSGVFFDPAQPQPLIDFLKRPDCLTKSLMVHKEFFLRL
jgi:hypothetical protein